MSNKRVPPSVAQFVVIERAELLARIAELEGALVELLRSKFPRIAPCQPVPLSEKAHCCDYTLYVERERLHRLIDALLASLNT